MPSPLRLSVLAATLSLAFAAQAQQANPANAEKGAGVEPAPAAAEPQKLDNVQVRLGRGQVRSVHALTKVDFEQMVPGTSPLQSVTRLPGVNFQSADPLGAYEWSTRFTVRAFSQNQLGFTLDDVPLGDMSYGNMNGLHISRAIISENVSRAILSQGSGALDTASASNLGGTLQFYSIKPAKEFGGTGAVTLGSQKNRRAFVRLDTGTTALGEWALSVVSQNADKWKGAGQQRQKQLNVQWAQDLGATQLSGFVNASQRREVDYQDFSFDMLRRLGDRFDNTYPDFAAALKISNTLCGNGGSTYVSQCDDAYYAGAGLRDDQLAGLTVQHAFSDTLQLKVTPYYHHNKGMGLWFTPYQASPDGTPLSLRTTEYGIRRAGVVSSLTAQLEQHELKLAFWHENNDFDHARRFYATPVNAVPSVYDFPSNPFLTKWQYAFNTKTDMVSLSDQVTINPKLTLNLGVKSLTSKINADLQQGSGMPSGSIKASKQFLPQLGMAYQLSPRNELFAAYTENMRAFQGAATGTTPFATSDVGFNAIKDKLKPETSTTMEAGWRHTSSALQATLTGYLVRFDDRLLGVQQGTGIQGNPVVLSNVGSVDSAGVEGALSVRIAPGVTWYGSWSESRSTYASNVVSNGQAVKTAGKTVADAPDRMIKSVLSYDDGALFANWGVDYMSVRYYTYLNDIAVPGRTLQSATVGYRMKQLGGLKEATVQLNVSNLTNRHYISTIGSNGFSNSDAGGTSATLLPGAPRQFFLSLTGKF